MLIDLATDPNTHSDVRMGSAEELGQLGDSGGSCPRFLKPLIDSLPSDPQ